VKAVWTFKADWTFNLWGVIRRIDTRTGVRLSQEAKGRYGPIVVSKRAGVVPRLSDGYKNGT